MQRFAKRGSGIADCILTAPRDETVGTDEASAARRDSIQLREARAGVVEILADAPRIQIETTAALRGFVVAETSARMRNALYSI